MTGAFINALGILIGGLAGLAMLKPLSLRSQIFLRFALGAGTVFFGLQLVWLSLPGTFLPGLKQIGVAVLATIVGFWIGRLLRLQHGSNRLGRYAGRLITDAQSSPSRKKIDGLLACSILFCAAPLGALGALADGLPPTDSPYGYCYLLAIKGVMDGMAMTGFMKIFGWPAALSAFPVFALFSGITLACRLGTPWLAAHGLVGPIDTVAGFIAEAIALMIFEVRRVEMANFLPGLAVAPLLAWWWLA